MATEELYHVVCPSGLSGMIRPITVGDINAFSVSDNRNNRNKKVDVLGRFFSGLWKRTTDLSVYETGNLLEADQPIEEDKWKDILLGDRSVLFLESRKVTLGSKYYFTVKCSCGRRIDEMIDLEDLQISPLSDEAKKAISNTGVRDAVIYTELPKAKTNVGIKLFNGRDQIIISNASQNLNSETADLAGLLCRIPYIAGIDSPGERKKFFKSLNITDVEFLREFWEYHDIYVQDTIEIECNCGRVSEVSLPLDHAFLSARSTRPQSQQLKRGSKAQEEESEE